MTTTWRFTSLDTWFFRESRPIDSIGNAELASVFPPPVRTVAGAIRTAIGEALGADWQAFKHDPRYHINGRVLHDIIGRGDNMGSLCLSGPWLSQITDGRWQRLYPIPLNLAASKDGETSKNSLRLKLGTPRWCDLGAKVPMAFTPEKNIRPLTNRWLNASRLKQVLAGEALPLTDLIEADALYTAEPRLGIARNNRLRTVEQSMLYQTQHIRPRPDVAIEIDVCGIDDALIPNNGMVRLGGEGRAALFETAPCSETTPTPPEPASDTHGILLTLLTPAHIPDAKADSTHWAPLPGFQREEQGKVLSWQGEINGIGLRLHGAIAGKAVREGGWDVERNAPRPVQSLVPAGSVYYCTVNNGDIAGALSALHLSQIGSPQDRALGRGHLAAGLWPNNEYVA